jgi:hypothetical protein
MNAEVTPIRRVDVLFHFTDSDLPGTVSFHPSGMVLDIPGGEGPYRIIGRLVGSHYEGRNELSGNDPEVNAKWADLGGEFVGIWREGSEVFYFAFST